MKYNCFGITFWFNIFNDYNIILNSLQKEFKDEYNKFDVFSLSDNLLNPIIVGVNNNLMTNISFSPIKLQYSMDKVSIEDYESFEEKALKLFNLLNDNGITVCHTSVFINAEEEMTDILKVITKNAISKKFNDDDFVDFSLKIGKKHEDLFYKVITVLNKKQVKLPHITDNNGNVIPYPLLSWQEATFEREIVDLSYEINDKYSYDHNKDYHTTEFYLNKMLFLLKDNFNDDIHNVIEKGKF